MPKLNITTITQDPGKAFLQLAVIKNVIHIVDAVTDFFTSRKLLLLKYFAETTLTQTIFGSIKTFQPSFTNKVALTSTFLLMPKPPSYLGRQILP